MYEKIKKYHDLKNLFSISEDIFDIYSNLKCRSIYGNGSRLIITPTIESSKDIFIKFQQENKVGSFEKIGNIFKIIINDEEILIYDIEYLLTHHLDGRRFKSINFME